MPDDGSKRKNVDPGVGHARANLATATRWHPDEVPNKLRDLAAAKLEAYIKRTVDAAPPLTVAQRTRLRDLLGPVAVTADDIDELASDAP